MDGVKVRKQHYNSSDDNSERSAGSKFKYNEKRSGNETRRRYGVVGVVRRKLGMAG